MNRQFSSRLAAMILSGAAFSSSLTTVWANETKAASVESAQMSEEELQKMAQEAERQRQAFINSILQSKPFSVTSSSLSNGKVELLNGGEGYSMIAKITGTLSPDAGGKFPLSVQLGAFGDYVPQFVSPGNTSASISLTPGQTVDAYTPKLDNSTKVLTYTFNVDSDPLTGFTVSYAPGNGQQYGSQAEFLIDASGITLSGQSRPETSLKVADDLHSATLSVPQESGASYQWKKEVSRSAYGDPVAVTDSFQTMPGETSASLTIPQSSKADYSGGIYLCEITKNGQKSYSSPVKVPVKNELLNSSKTYQISLDKAKTITNPQQLLDALNLQMKYDVYKMDKGNWSDYIMINGGPVEWLDHRVSILSQQVELCAPAGAPFDYAQLQSPGSYGAVVHTLSNGIVDSLMENITIQVTDGSQPSNGLFADVPADAWYAADVLKANQMGLIKGSNGRFNPDSNLKRGDLALILHRLAGEPKGQQGQGFADVNPGQYYYDAILWASKNGIVTGYTDSGTFKPENNVSRQELVTMLSRYAKNIKGLSTDSSQNINAFPDAAYVSDYARVPMAWGAQNKILNGKLINGTSFLSPSDTAKRCEAAKMLVSFTALLG